MWREAGGEHRARPPATPYAAPGTSDRTRAPMNGATLNSQRGAGAGEGVCGAVGAGPGGVRRGPGRGHQLSRGASAGGRVRDGPATPRRKGKGGHCYITRRQPRAARGQPRCSAGGPSPLRLSSPCYAAAAAAAGWVCSASELRVSGPAPPPPRCRPGVAHLPRCPRPPCPAQPPRPASRAPAPPQPHTALAGAGRRTRNGITPRRRGPHSPQARGGRPCALRGSPCPSLSGRRARRCPAPPTSPRRLAGSLAPPPPPPAGGVLLCARGQRVAGSSQPALNPAQRTRSLAPFPGRLVRRSALEFGEGRPAPPWTRPPLPRSSPQRQSRRGT